MESIESVKDPTPYREIWLINKPVKIDDYVRHKNREVVYKFSQLMTDFHSRFGLFGSVVHTISKRSVTVRVTGKPFVSPIGLKKTPFHSIFSVYSRTRYNYLNI